MISEKIVSKPFVSVIVPIYNVELFLHRCIDSILAQTYTYFELLLIDDGSNDMSGHICDEYATKDKRVRVFHKKNEGISKTRQFGLDKSKGEFIQFVDSDDWINNDMLCKLIEVQNSCDADIVSCDFFIEKSDDSMIVRIPFCGINEYRRMCIKSYWTVLWHNLFRKQLICENNINFPLGIDGGEDYQFVVTCAICANCVAYCNSVLYHYNCMNIQSFMNTPNYQKLIFQVEATNNVVEYLTSLGKISQYQKEILERKYQVLCPIVKYYPTKSISIYKEVDLWGLKEKWHIKGLRKQICMKGKFLYKILKQKFK